MANSPSASLVSIETVHKLGIAPIGSRPTLYMINTTGNNIADNEHFFIHVVCILLIFKTIKTHHNNI